MSGLAHVFPFQRPSTPPPFGEVKAPSPERKQVPAVLVDEAEAITVQGDAGGTARPQSTPALENEQMQVFEPLEVGDLTPTPSEQSGGSPRRTPEETAKAASERVNQTVDTNHAEPVTDSQPLPISTFSEETALESSSIESPHTSATSVGARPVQDSVEESHDTIEFPAYSSAFMPASPPKTVSEVPREDPAQATDETVQMTALEPFSISHVAKKYYIHDPNTIAFVRREYNMCGVLVGTLPSHPQQNVFLGTPLSLMPEEARRLVETGAAYIVDDTAVHKAGILGGGIPEAERRAFARAMEKQGVEAMRASQKKADDVKKEILKKNAEKIAAAREAKQKERQQKREEATQTHGRTDPESESLFNAPAPRPSSPTPSSLKSTSPGDERYYITPTTSHPPLPTGPASSPASSTALLPPAPSSYPLFAYLHSRGFFMTPGLRFGCQYTAYPGDPLRFHSHFLAVGMGWDEPFDLMRLVGGGRLGTGVKKAFLIGARDDDNADETDAAEGVRAFSVEWSGM